MSEVISTFEKNTQEEVRTSITEYKGHKLIDLRVYFKTLDGKTGPTKKGLTLSVGLYHDLKKGIDELGAALKEKGLIEV